MAQKFGAGRCKKCLSEDLEYDDYEVEVGGDLHYPYTCKTCGHEGNEYYDVTYHSSD